LPVKQNPASGDFTGRLRDQTQDTESRNRFSASGFTNETYRFLALHIKTDAIHGLCEAVVAAKVDFEVLHGK
jgi:hypothetical protein